jgi:ethanolamine utilization protein EutA (predicted chaperonin)
MDTNIKVCGDPHCEAVYHNVPASEKRCKDCGGRIMKINSKTYNYKYASNYFQYDYPTMEYIHKIN